LTTNTFASGGLYGWAEVPGIWQVLKFQFPMKVVPTGITFIFSGMSPVLILRPTSVFLLDNMTEELLDWTVHFTKGPNVLHPEIP
jgi:CO dehydrogenase/acetyl-CoA synthase delta subunit